MSRLVKVSADNYVDAFLMAEEFFKESPLFGKMRIDRRMLVDEIVKSTLSEHRFGMLGYVQEKPAGMVFGRRINLLFSQECIAQDILFYVRPEFRATLLVKSLIQAFERWALEDPTCVMVQLTALAGKDNDRAARLGQILGFNKSGYVLLKERQ